MTNNKKRLSPQDILNNIREKAKLGDSDFNKSVAIKLKQGKIKFQLVAKSEDYLFRPRTQHSIPTVPNEEDKNEKWMIADCAGNNCPVCAAVDAFKRSGIDLDSVNEAYKPKYPYKNLRSVFTQAEHYLLCGKILADQADEGSYLPKDSELGSVHLIQFTRTALNNLMSAYEDFIEDNDDDDDIPPLFAIFDEGEDVAKSLVITCRVTFSPYSCTFSFNRAAEIKRSDVDEDKLDLLQTAPKVPDEHYTNCVKRINKIKNYFVADSANYGNNQFGNQVYSTCADGDDDDVPFYMSDDSGKISGKSSSGGSKLQNTNGSISDDDDGDFNIDDEML